MEINPTFQKALQLLISQKPDSAEKLKEMLFESLGREYIPPTAVKVEGKLKPQISHSHDSIESLDDEDDEINEMEAETDCSTDVGGAKNDDTMDADDFAFDMGISCVICRQFDVSSNNQLLECQECHNLYHQLCHEPEVKDKVDANDSAWVWFCHKCTPSTKDTPNKTKMTEVDTDLVTKKEKGSTSEAFKKPSKKSEKLSADSKKPSDSSKDKKVKADKKVKEKLIEKIKDSEKEKLKKHKSSDKDLKSESGRKEKGSSKLGESARGAANTSSKSTFKDKSSDGHTGKQKSSGDLKHKRTDSVSDKEKKLKKIKKEKSE